MSTENIIEENQKKITNLWNGIISMLPTQPRSFDTSDDPGFWTNGEEILCPSEAEMNMAYEFVNDMFREFGNYTLITGWYDPEEDRKNGEQDYCTGFNYVRLERLEKNTMSKYKVEIVETYRRYIEVEAEDEDAAWDDIANQIEEGVIDLPRDGKGYKYDRELFVIEIQES